MEDLTSLLSASIRHYEDILAMFVTINNNRGNYNPTTLHARSTELLHLQQEVALADDALAIAMKEINPDPDGLFRQLSVDKKTAGSHAPDPCSQPLIIGNHPEHSIPAGP